MKNIDKVIYNALVSRQSTELPGVGTLSVTHTSAGVSKGKVTAPVNKVVFSSDRPEGTTSVIDLIVGFGLSGEDAQKNYNSWLDGARTDTGVKIEEVGVIKGGRFYPVDNFDKHLNPPLHKGGDPMSKSEKMWLILIPLFILTLGIGWCVWYNSDGRMVNKKGSVEQVQIVPADTVSTQTTAGDIQTDNRVEVPVTRGPLYHVVCGVFSIPENADRYVTSLKAEYPDFEAQKMEYSNGRVLVSIYSSTSEREATNRRNAIEDQMFVYDLWVYKTE